MATPIGRIRLEAWLLERGIRAVGYVRNRCAGGLVLARVNRPAYFLERAREAVRADCCVRSVASLTPSDRCPCGGDQRASTVAVAGVHAHRRQSSDEHFRVRITMVASLAYLLVLRLCASPKR